MYWNAKSHCIEETTILINYDIIMYLAKRNESKFILAMTK